MSNNPNGSNSASGGDRRCFCVSPEQHKPLPQAGHASQTVSDSTAQHTLNFTPNQVYRPEYNANIILITTANKTIDTTQVNIPNLIFRAKNLLQQAQVKEGMLTAGERDSDGKEIGWKRIPTVQGLAIEIALRRVGQELDIVANALISERLKVSFAQIKQETGRTGKKEWDTAHKEKTEVTQETFSELQSHKNPFVTAQQRIEQETLIEVLTMIRPMGPNKSGVKSSGPHSDLVLQAMAVYPTAWVVKSNTLGEIKTKTGSRSFYCPGWAADENGVWVSDNNGDGIIVVESKTRKPELKQAIAIHELGHRMEHVNPQITQIEQVFLARRATVNGQVPEPKQLAGTVEREIGWENNFTHSYVGKIYAKSEFKEVFSVGMEAVFGRSHGGLIGREGQIVDFEHRYLILGTLATL